MTSKQIEDISYVIIEWCMNTFKRSKYHKDLPLVIVKYAHERYKNCYGEYDIKYNIMFIYSKRNRAVLQLVNTIIHEFVHHLQSPNWTMRYLEKYGRKVNKNPYEIEAYTISNKFNIICAKEIEKKVNKILKKRR